jgi:hypothetical protein
MKFLPDAGFERGLNTVVGLFGESFGAHLWRESLIKSGTSGTLALFGAQKMKWPASVCLAKNCEPHLKLWRETPSHISFHQS